MSIPTTNIYVRPGWTSSSWTYGGATLGAAAITAVAFDIDAAAGQQVARGDFQYSVDGGQSWAAYQIGAQGSLVPAAGTLWRFVDHAPDDSASLGSFTMRFKLADNSIVTSAAAVVADTAPAGIVGDRDTMFSTLHAGDAVATLAPIDAGDPLGGRWVIDGQSQPGLFSVAANADGSATLVLAGGAALPAAGATATVDVHYYDRYQLDSAGHPIAGQGVAQGFTYTVQQGTSQDLAGFGADLALGAGPAAAQGSPALATLADGGIIAAWQGQGQDGAGAVLAQLRDASGAARGAQFALQAQPGSAALAPAVAALADGRAVVAYTLEQGGASHIAYRIVEANGSVGAQCVADAAGAGDAAMPAVAALADGSFVIGWSSGGAVHTRQADAHGALAGTEQVTGALGSAFSPALAALHGGGYVLSWGEINDGNVYLAVGGGAPQMVTTDGAAASISTAAPLPHVAALAGGGFVVAWDSYSNDPRGFTQSDIFFQRYDDAGHPLGDPTQADVTSGSGRFDAAVAALADGGFVITWQAQGGDYDANGVFGRRFDAGGSARDAQEFEVNQQRQGDQASPAVTALKDGGFATAWTDTQHGGAASAIELRLLYGAAGGAGPDGAAAPVQLAGTGAADTFTPAGASNAIDGGGGVDTVVYHGKRTAFTLLHDGAGFDVTDAATGAHHDTLANVERIKFDDAMVALDIDGTAGQAYRLYQAAFDRAPDQAGLGYWIKMMDGGATLDQVAAGFVASKEFAGLYGANASDAQFVQMLYQNVLHRSAEGAGYDYWMDALGHQHAPREQVLGFFSESAENQAQVIGSIQDGMAFIPWG